jgi:hypothetical protein
VLPLVRDRKTSSPPGWCTYTYEHEQAPELEVLCGGVNHKTPKAGAIWRQGHLLHFGFEPSPERLNETGQALLVNAICYIARFTEDRPIVRTPCVFVQGTRLVDRGVIGRTISNPSRDLKVMDYFLTNSLSKELANKDRAAVAAWYEQVRDYLHALPDGKLAVDEEARKFGTAPASIEFLTKGVISLDDPNKGELARRLLVRYAPQGPGADSAAEWQKWLKTNQPYLFFSDTGGYRWYVDRLAKRRGVPTAQLRGPARATKAGVNGGGSVP